MTSWPLDLAGMYTSPPPTASPSAPPIRTGKPLKNFACQQPHVHSQRGAWLRDTSIRPWNNHNAEQSQWQVLWDGLQAALTVRPSCLYHPLSNEVA